MEGNSTHSLPTGERGELSLLTQIRARAGHASGGVRLGIGDDCALLRLRSGEELAVTTDLSIAGRHFQMDWHPAKSVGHRALARGLSDLAAMGARPVAAFLSLGLPPELTRPSARHRRPQPSALPDAGPSSWLTEFFDGLLALAATHHTPLAGGDLAESPLAIADIVLAGAVPRGKALLRSGARPGHQLYVTGSLGGAAAALARLADLAKTSPSAQPARQRRLRIPKKLETLLAAHLYPQPRIAQGLWLRRRAVATAAIDLSDGLSTDLTHLCEESRVAAEVDAALLPIHPAATLAQALHGGEDYELLFTVPENARVPRAIAGVPITRIGRMVQRKQNRPAVTILTPPGKQALAPRGWEHFS
jgi:thiamine-monophosphate kinase